MDEPGKALQRKDTAIMAIEQLPSSGVQQVVDEFTNLYFSSYERTWMNTSWLGVSIQKVPFDLWIYQEIVYELKPDLIIETGTLYGGSALYLATLLDILDNGQIVTIDIEQKEGRPQHKRITYLTGSSISEEIVAIVGDLVKPAATVMVILDSDHAAEHVLTELRIYHPFVTTGSYLIVEDTVINGHPILSGVGPGPMEALDAFMRENESFIVDETKEKFFLTWNPRGYLRRIK